MPHAGLAAILLGALVVRAGGQPAPCPGQGYDAVACDVARVAAAATCAPRAVKVLVRAALRRVQRRVEAARRADADGAPHGVALQLGKAGDRVATLTKRVDGLRARSRLPEACAAPVLDALAAVDRDLTALRAGPSTTTTTTTTTPASGSTATSTVGGASTTSTTGTTTTTVPTCGNGRLDPGEQCDGTNLFGRTCLSLGFHGGGQLMCRDCLFDNHDCRF